MPFCGRRRATHSYVPLHSMPTTTVDSTQVRLALFVRPALSAYSLKKSVACTRLWFLLCRAFNSPTPFIPSGPLTKQTGGTDMPVSQAGFLARPLYTQQLSQLAAVLRCGAAYLRGNCFILCAVFSRACDSNSSSVHRVSELGFEVLVMVATYGICARGKRYKGLCISAQSRTAQAAPIT